MDDFASVVTGAAGLVAGVRTAEGRALSGMVWQDGVVVVSEQGLKDSESYRVFLPGGGEAAATLVGRDKGTNVAVLRAKGARGSMIERAEAAVGGFAVALGSDGAGGVTARLGVVHRVGPEWHSMGGGRIDRLIVLDARVAWHEEGGPVLDSAGHVLGISTLGPRRRVLVIPTDTVERSVEALLRDGHVARGWLGVALQPVGLPDAARSAAGSDGGLIVVGLSSGGPAEQAGVLLGDVVLSVDGAAMRSPRDLGRHVTSRGVGAACGVRVLRAGAVQEVPVTVGARPA